MAQELEVKIMTRDEIAKILDWIHPMHKHQAKKVLAQFDAMIFIISELQKKIDAKDAPVIWLPGQG
jgi:hypothetical protein